MGSLGELLRVYFHLKTCKKEIFFKYVPNIGRVNMHNCHTDLNLFMCQFHYDENESDWHTCYHYVPLCWLSQNRGDLQAIERARSVSTKRRTLRWHWGSLLSQNWSKKITKKIIYDYRYGTISISMYSPLNGIRTDFYFCRISQHIFHYSSKRKIFVESVTFRCLHRKDRTGLFYNAMMFTWGSSVGLRSQEVLSCVYPNRLSQLQPSIDPPDCGCHHWTEHWKNWISSTNKAFTPNKTRW